MRISPFALKANVITAIRCASMVNFSTPIHHESSLNPLPYLETHMSNIQTIYCFNNSTMLKTSDMALMIAALNTQLPAFCNAWNRPQYRCVAAPSSMRPGSYMYCNFLDAADMQGALAYHTETNNVPFSRVFVKTILSYGGAIQMGATASVPTVAQAFSHEIYEMIGNQNVNVWWQRPDGNLVPAEVTDPVQGAIVPVKVGSITVGLSDYVMPNWADPQATARPFNFLNTLTRPFQVAKGGYVVLMRGGSMSYVFGASATSYVMYKADLSAHSHATALCPFADPVDPVDSVESVAAVSAPAPTPTPTPAN